MTMPTKPGSVPSDPMAVERLRTLLNDQLDEQEREHELGGVGRRDVTVDLFPAVTFVHDKNSAGVPMRRVVAYGEWEMDPNPPAKRHPNCEIHGDACAGDPNPS